MWLRFRTWCESRLVELLGERSHSPLYPRYFLDMEVWRIVQNDLEYVDVVGASEIRTETSLLFVGVIIEMFFDAF